ncbi:MAG: hypothetical protein PHD01_03240 [Geobacteraceae bacterium]|nr:hypothetical protein [Geobacteraceae bacterium]
MLRGCCRRNIECKPLKGVPYDLKAYLPLVKYVEEKLMHDWSPEEIARTELAAARVKGLKPSHDCKAETDALPLSPLFATWPANQTKDLE